LDRERTPLQGGRGAKREVKTEFMEVKVLFFGVLADISGTAIKHYSDVRSTGDLKLRIQDDFPEIVHYNFRIALNNAIIDKEVDLKSGDEVALMPPFAGG
jgi:sulfur-carrier protein